MVSLNAMLTASANALDVFQQALSVVQSNVNNSSTPGYATQSLNLDAQPMDLADGLTGGVTSGGLDNSRDPYAEQEVQQQTQALGKYTAQANATSSLQSFFDATGTSGVSADLSSFFQSVSAWSVTPSDATLGQAVLDSASTLASSIQGLANSLSQNAQQLNTSIASTADQINSIAAQIQAYNAQRVTETTPDPGQDAQLYSALDNLSQLTNFSTVTQSDGTVTVLLAGGSPLVIGQQQYQISTASSATGAQVLGANGNDITSQITGGQLGGLLDVRNRVLGSMLGDGQQTGSLNQFASTLADTVNQILESGKVSSDPGAAAGTALFTYDTSSDAASTIELNPSITPSQLAPVDSSGNANGNANQIAALANQTLSQLGGESLTQFFGEITSDIGTENQNATTNEQSQQQVVAQATTIVNQVSGVSLDDQATNVLQFQRAYQAAAQVLTTIDNLANCILDLIQPTAV